LYLKNVLCNDLNCINNKQFLFCSSGGLKYKASFLCQKIIVN
jgi:hypothetical protein